MSFHRLRALGALMLLASCSTSAPQPPEIALTPDTERAAEDPPADDLPQTLPEGCPEVGQRIALARQTWTLKAAGAQSLIHTSALFGDAMVLLGAYNTTLTVGQHSAVGGGLFAAWVDKEGRAQRLERLTGGYDRASYVVAAHVHADRLWLLIHFEDRLDLHSAAGITAAGSNHALIALDSTGRITDRWVLRGTASDLSLASTTERLLITGTTQGSITLYPADGPAAAPLQGTEKAYSPGHGFAITLPLVGSATGWLIDGTAGSGLRAAPSMIGYYAAGRFGGFGELRATIGDGPTLTSVSADDDTAYDVFLAHADAEGTSWAKRIRSYSGEMNLPVTSHRGDLVAAIASDGYATVFSEGDADEVRITSEKSRFFTLARFAADGTRRFARDVPPLSALRSDECGLWGVGASWVEPWIANAGTPEQIRPEIAAEEHAPLARIDELGAVIAVRVPAIPKSWTVAPAWPSAWLAHGSGAVGEPFTVCRLDW